MLNIDLLPFQKETVMDAEGLIKEFNEINNDETLTLDRKNTRLAVIAKQLIDVTIDCYNKTAEQYGDIKLRSEIDEFNTILWDVFSKSVNKVFHSMTNIKILDIGAGTGRDLLHGQIVGKGAYDMYGIEIPDSFINSLDNLFKSGQIKNKVKKCDMRDIDYPDGFFDVVRHNATLLHMPVIAKGYTADKAIEEAHRVLKKGGLLYINVKGGESGLRSHNTNEGLGERVFQFFSMDLLHEVTERNGFKVIVTEELHEVRPKETIVWLVVMAQKI